jgi:hypothetical protein
MYLKSSHFFKKCDLTKILKFKLMALKNKKKENDAPGGRLCCMNSIGFDTKTGH